MEKVTWHGLAAGGNTAKMAVPHNLWPGDFKPAPGFVRKDMKILLKTKLIISFLAVILFCGLISTLFVMLLIGRVIILLAQ